MRLQTRNKYVARFLGWLLNIERHEFHFHYHVEKYDPDLTEFGFLNQQLTQFDEMVEEFREETLQAMEDAQKDQAS